MKFMQRVMSLLLSCALALAIFIVAVSYTTSSRPGSSGDETPHWKAKKTQTASLNAKPPQNLNRSLLLPTSSTTNESVRKELNSDNGGGAPGSRDRMAPITSDINFGPPDPWMLWNKEWVGQEYLYPEDVFWSGEMNGLLRSLATERITGFDVGYKGTQLKATMMLGEQKTVFKPMRCNKQTNKQTNKKIIPISSQSLHLFCIK